jgi:hypothetical protein
MTQKSAWHGVLIVVLSVALAKPGDARGYPSSGGIVAAIVAAGAAVVVVAVVVIHESTKKRTITACVNPGGSGMTVTDEKDRQTYALSGNTESIKPGERMKLQGKKVKSKGLEKALVWETALSESSSALQAS